MVKPTEPTPKKGPKPKKERRNWKTPFLAALAKSPNVTGAARKARVNRPYVYEEREANPEFAKAWDDAINQPLDLAEGELYRRAVTGVRKPVTIAGQRELITEHSDTLLIFLLKSHRPERYRETTRNLNLNLTPEQIANLTDDELDKLEAALARRT